ncbi:hypothetical protein [Cellulophaga lytica]|uniref:Uncharacterized protein n=1 Tax=Cellulophaga lytica (strain ATCC 23178 / DSM 7489 / JCM 8516 / NBRC 14961 / NCIMB 1423 / VKM B-1433 / Cy l20) TaxID=867900 RepID=F0RDJ5_CELLC|nr:hypothetical protein [Cellulophaga lytica]ADY28743.1 hypothetical protein Celly_0911 [Cellulophaga lytica DSM 7489]MDO6854845.1 hypothetical protein [Cellulophaga lytica]WQG77078.1 hypothetical protein SR888_15460 [Cellulophaga lytica]
MKQTLLIIAIVICLKPIFPFMEYVVNYDYISKVLCINQDKPELECNGKCALMKSIEKSTQEEHNEQGVVKSEFQLLFHQNNQDVFVSTQISPQKKSKILSAESNYHFKSVFSLLRPPIS